MPLEKYSESFLFLRKKVAHSRRSRGFSLVELLVVFSVIAILTAAAMSSMTGLTASGRFNHNTMDLGEILEGARQYAVAQNTFVWVGIASRQDNNIDLMNVVVVAAADGIDNTVYGSSSGSNTISLPGQGYIVIKKTTTFPQIKLQAPGAFNFSTLPSTISPVGANNAPSAAVTFNVLLPGASTPTAFTTSLEFTPTGQVRNGLTPIDLIELDIQSAPTSSAPSAANVAVLRLSGLTGQLNVYRP